MFSSKIEAEYLEIAKTNAWACIFQNVGRESLAYPYTFIEAKKQDNKPFNRYRDVNPYDHSRIVLKRFHKDYINASLVTMERANRSYILTQGPLSFTVDQFWLMIWEQNSRAIVMLNRIIEKNEIKCHWYWPHGNGEPHKMLLKDVNLIVEQISSEEKGFYTTRIFRLFDIESGESRDVLQFHYLTWPDFGVPASPHEFLDFHNQVKASGALVVSEESGPPVVHCSAGIGRSGTFCLVDSCLEIIQKEQQDSLDIRQILLELRKGRMGLIQTPDQLRFSYLAIIEGARHLDPNWRPDENSEHIYATVNDEPGNSQQLEEAPPLPPPRLESRPPARPLPNIPNSVSLGDLDLDGTSSSSDSEGPPPTPPPRPSPFKPAPLPERSEDESEDEPLDEAPSEANAETIAEKSPLETEEPESADALRRRRNKNLADRVSAMKRRARDAEKWHSIKRSLYKPLTITFGVLIAGIVIYAYIKN